MLTTNDIEVVAKQVLDLFQRGKFKAMLPPIRAEINYLKHVGNGHSLVENKQGEALAIRGLINGKFIKISQVGPDLEISLVGLPEISTVHFENLRGVSVRNPKDGDILCFMDGAWRQVAIDDFETIKAFKLVKSYPDEDKAKLKDVQPGAQVNPDAKSIKESYESNPNTNAYTNEEKASLADVRTRSHSHKNRELIDEYTVKNSDIERAATSAHIHPNATVLNKIHDPGSGKVITEEERAGLQELLSLLPVLKQIASQQ